MLLTGIQVALREITEKAWASGDYSWSDVQTWIDVQMEHINEARGKLERRLIDRARPPWFLRWAA